MGQDKEKALRDQIVAITNGANPSETLSSGVPEEAKHSGVPCAVVGDKYLEFVRSGSIVPRIGRVVSLKVQPNQLLSATIFATKEIRDITATVYATGFETTTNFGFLEEHIKERLGFEPRIPRLPFKLDTDLCTTTAALPDLALVGFGGGPYWGILEMQARKAAERFSVLADGKPNPYVPSIVDARNMELVRNDLAWKPRQGMVCAARYLDSGSQAPESENTMAELQKLEKEALETTRFLARAVFRSIHGFWKADTQSSQRDSSESDPAGPAGSAGSMRFHPRRPSGGDHDYEYVCLLDRIGSPGNPGSKHRSIWRYEETTDRITIWSADHDNNPATLQQEQHLVFRRHDPDGAKQAIHAEVVVVGTGGGRASFPFSSLGFEFGGVHVTELSARSHNGDGEGDVVFRR
ncbi:MAG: hypothetical protein LQ340_006771 [Diploschistes diacapsis]|nr:MAG: hypothetical protein LQ340_006771 [Diploschistes diacapsis]